MGGKGVSPFLVFSLQLSVGCSQHSLIRLRQLIHYSSPASGCSGPPEPRHNVFFGLSLFRPTVESVSLRVMRVTFAFRHNVGLSGIDYCGTCHSVGHALEDGGASLEGLRGLCGEAFGSSSKKAGINSNACRTVMNNWGGINSPPKRRPQTAPPSTRSVPSVKFYGAA